MDLKAFPDRAGSFPGNALGPQKGVECSLVSQASHYIPLPAVVLCSIPFPAGPGGD